MLVNNKKRFLVGFTLLGLTGVMLVTLVDLPQFFDKSISGSLRTSVLRTAKIAIPLKDRLLGRTIADKLVRIQTTGACQFCDLRNVDFRGIDLHGADLRRTDLSGTNLSAVDLRGANLTGANLTRANLTKTFLYGTKLVDANLHESKLAGADLTQAFLIGADLTRANLSWVDLREANLREANLREAVLARANLSRTILTGANLTGANLTGANLTGANLTGVDLSGHDLSGTTLVQAILSGANLNGVDLSGKDLTGANLTGVDLSGHDLSGTTLVQAMLSGANLNGVDLSGKDLTGANLTGMDLSGHDLSGTTLVQAMLSGANLNEVDLSGKDLTGANLTGMDLSGHDLSGTTLVQAMLSGANLNGVDLSGKDLTGANLSKANLTGANLTGANLTKTFLYGTKLVDANLHESKLAGARLSGVDLTGANLIRADVGDVGFKGTGRRLDKDLIEIRERGNYTEVTSFYLGGQGHYLATKSGLLYEVRDEESMLVLDLNKVPNFRSAGNEMGLVGVVSNDKFIYISYTTQDDDGHIFLVVDEYSKTFQKVRTIIQIGMTQGIHHAGTLVFDKLGMLYLSVGDGNLANQPQNLESLRGKILRLDITKINPEPEIVAYGLRNPWKISIDSKNRMFVGDCGSNRVESIYLIDNLYPTTPYNLGWPVFEGTDRLRREDPLRFRDTLAPIYEYRHLGGVGICVIGGFFLDEPEVYLFGDFAGILRLLKKQKDGKWYEIHFQHMATNIYSLGYDEETKKLFISGSSKIFELSIPYEQINFLPQVRLCRTTMPDGTVNNSSC